MSDKDTEVLSLREIQELITRDLGKGIPDVYDGQTPAWRKKFQSWASKDVLNQNYFAELLASMRTVPVYYLTSVRVDNKAVNFHQTEYFRGYLAALKDLETRVQQAATPEPVSEE